MRPWLPALVSSLLACGTASAQFLDDLSTVRVDPAGSRGWRFATGAGSASVDFRQGGPGYGSILVDARSDKRNVWWALIERSVSGPMDLGLLRKPGHEVRIEARIRTSHAPRRVNLQVLTQRTTDWHSHLMEFEIADTRAWHTISMTTRGFDAGPGDVVIGHLALMDWGLEQYRVDVDYLKVDVVDAASAGPDQGEAVPYHPPLRDPASFAHVLPVAHDSLIDPDHPDLSFNDWRAQDGATTLLAVDGSRFAILRWEMGACAGRKVAGAGLLELTTWSVERKAEDVEDFGLLRVVEILGGDPRWDQETVTAESLRQGRPLSEVLNPQMIIDWPVTPGQGGKTGLTIPRPVLQRLAEGRTLGIAIQPLGAIHAAFHAMENDAGKHAARLRFNLE
jgi:hypothetical protein